MHSCPLNDSPERVVIQWKMHGFEDGIRKWEGGNMGKRRDIKLILAASFCYMACPMLVTPLIAGFAESLGANGMVMGVIGGLMNLCSLACRPIAGNLTDRISKYKLSLVGAVLMSVACVGYVRASGTAELMFARIVHGVGFSFCSVCMSTWMAGLLSSDRIGSGMGIYGTMNALSMAVAPSLGIILYQRLGYRAAFALAAAFPAVTALLIQFVGDHGQPPISGIVQRKSELLERNVIPVALIVTLFTIPYCATQSFLVKYVEARTLAVSVSLFFPLYAVSLFVMRIVLKNYFDKIPFETFMKISAASALGSMLCLTVMRGNTLLILAAVLMAGGYGINCSVSQSTSILLAQKGKEGLANSTYYLGLDLGMALGPILGGQLYEHLGMVWFYPLMMSTIPLCFAVKKGAAMAGIPIRRKGKT